MNTKAPARRLTQFVPLSLSTALALACTPSGCMEDSEQKEPQPELPDQLPKRPEHPPKAPHLDEVLQKLRTYQDTHFRPPTKQEMSSYQLWMEEVLGAAWAGFLPESTAPKGFVGQWVDFGKLWLLREENGHQRGAGVVVVRPQFETDLIVEVPHSYFDSWTLPIGRLAFQHLGARALLVNTFHRGGHGNAAERQELALSGESEFDVAHQKNTFFSTAHRSLLNLLPETLVIQFHGFSDESAPGVDLIVSSADTDFDIHPLTESLRKQLPGFVVKSYPDQIDVLGGTRNVQAQANRRDNSTDSPFVHLEMSHSLRKKLSKETKVLRRMADVLAQAGAGN